MKRPSLLAFAGAARPVAASPLAQLLAAAVRAAEAAGADTAALPQAALALPPYDREDLGEASDPAAGAAAAVPSAVTALRARLDGADAWILAAPDVRGAPAPALLNALAWAAHGRGDSPFAGKACILLAASGDVTGGLRGLNVLSAVLADVGMLVVPPLIGVGGAHQAFDAGGALRDPGLQARVDAAAAALLDAVRRLT